MIHWSVYNFGKSLKWISEKRRQAHDAVKEAGRNAQVDGIENRLIVGERHAIYVSLDDFCHQCSDLQLNASYQSCFHLLVHVGNPVGQCYWSDIESGMSAILGALESELILRKFAFIQPSKDKYFERDDLFGDIVNKVIPDAKADIKEAGNCLAADLNTAAVFHLMRVVEFGLRKLAADLKAKGLVKNLKQTKTPIEYGTWGQVIDTLEAKLDELNKRKRTAKRDKKIEVCREILKDFSFFKDLWRNKVMHTRASYDAKQAESAFEHVRNFMERLASISKL